MVIYIATGEEGYHDKFKAIADKEYFPKDVKRYPGATVPISCDDTRPGA